MSAKSFWRSSWFSQQAGTRYVAALPHRATNQATEANAQAKMRMAGTIRHLSMNISSVNNVTKTDTHRVRINGVDGNSVVICTGTTGQFTDLTHSDTVSIGDLVSLSGTGNGAVWNIQSKAPVIFEFEASGETTPVMMYGGTTGAYGVNGGFLRFGGGMSQFASNETQPTTLPAKYKAEGLLSQFRAYIYTNTKTSSVTFTWRKNGVDGTPTITIAAGTTGEFQDLVNTMTVAADDEINIHGTGPAANTLNVAFTSALFTPDDNEFDVFSGFLTSTNYGASASPAWYDIGEAPSVETTTESLVSSRVPFDCRAKLLRAYMTLTAATSGVLRLRVNGADSSLAVSISTGGALSGWFEDLTGFVDLAAGDLINYQIDGGFTTSGLANFGVFAFTINNDPNYVPPGAGVPLLFFFQ